MKKILLLAYTNINFGDDMFVKTICEFFPEQEFILNAPAKYSEVFSSVPNLTVKIETRLSRLWVRMIVKLMKLGFRNHIQRLRFSKYAAVVYVIGGLFDEDDIWQANVTRYGLETMKDIVYKHALCPSVPFFLLGCNMTRVNTETYVDQMKYLFSGLADICFRDRYSYQIFSDLQNVRYAPDVVFNYTCNTRRPASDEILISVWGALTHTDTLFQWAWAKDKWTDYEDFIIEIVRAFLKKNKKVRLLALCENEGDLVACTRIMEKGGFLKDVTTYAYRGNIEETISLFETAEFVIGTRFHSIVMAMNAGKPFYPIAYESKTIQLLKDIRYEAEFSYIEDAESYKLEYVMHQYETKQSPDCAEIKRQSAGQFQELGTFLRTLREVSENEKTIFE